MSDALVHRVFGDEGYSLEDAPKIPVVYMATIVRRQRGIWLANCSEDRNGTDAWDAFPTLAEAKRWCANWCGARLRWNEHRPGQWFAEHEAYEDDDA